MFSHVWVYTNLVKFISIDNDIQIPLAKLFQISVLNLQALGKKRRPKYLTKSKLGPMFKT